MSRPDPFKLATKLKERLGSEVVVSDPDLFDKYSHDETPDLYQQPILVLRPSSVAEIAEIMEFASGEDIPVVPRGGGTGLAGGAVPIKGSIVITFERMNQIVEIDNVNLVAVVQAGVITGNLASEVEKYDLFYPPDPASLDDCTIGGNIVTGAGGSNTLKYGTTKDYLMGLEVILADGRILKLGGKNVKDATGYNLIQLFAGSEGTLGIIGTATLKILPKPKQRIDFLIPFKNLKSAVKTATEILKSNIIPTTLELMEEEAITYVEGYLEKKFPFPKAEVLLLVRTDGDNRDQLMEQGEKISNLACNAVDCFVAIAPSEQRKLWEARRAISDALKSKGKLYHEDIVVPRSKIPEFVPEVHDLGDRYELDIILYGHLGDGNIHINLINPTKKKLQKFRLALYKLAKNLGGKISGEHGIGFIKKNYLNYSLGDDVIKVMQEIKNTLDPQGILNPGKVLPSKEVR